MDDLPNWRMVDWRITLPIPAEGRPIALVHSPMDNHDWGTDSTPLPTGYQPHRIRVPDESLDELRERWYEAMRGPMTAWDPERELVRRREARLAADRAMARGRQRG
jgi:hypothetical protein